MAKLRKSTKDILKDANVNELSEIDEHKLRDKWTLDRVHGLVSDKKLLKQQGDDLELFVNESLNKGVKVKSVCNKVMTLHNFASRVKKPFLKVTKNDVTKYFSTLRTVDKLAPSTLALKSIYVRHFFKWVYKENKIKTEEIYPDVVNHISSTAPSKELLPSQLLTQLEVRKMVESCHEQRNKALLMALYESGARATELISLKIKDVHFETHSVDITIRYSKTKPRVNTLIDSYVYLQQYFNNHPYKSDGEKPFFINFSTHHFGRGLQYVGLKNVVITASKRAKIKKKVTPHLFRHSRATELAVQNWTESQLREWFGWNRTSTMPSVYIHFGQADVKKKILKQNGLLNDEETVEDMQNRIALKPKVCARCNSNNPADAISCNCGFALSLASVEEIRKLKKESDQFIEKINKLPLRTEIISDNMTQLDYKKELIKKDPFLKAEFEKIAQEVISKMLNK